MMNYVWIFLLLSALVTGALTGKLDTTVTAGINSAKDSIFTVLNFAGIMCMWSGMMRICQDSGLTKIINKISKPVCKRLFPDTEPEGKAMKAVIMNITANLLGLGNAATPLGLKGMRELDSINPTPHIASDAMCVFIVLNTAALQLIPTTVVALRASAGAQNPFDVIVPIWISSLCSVIAGITAIKIFIYFENRKKNRGVV